MDLPRLFLSFSIGVSMIFLRFLFAFFLDFPQMFHRASDDLLTSSLPFLLHFASMLAPFLLHFGSIWAPFWLHSGSILAPFGLLGGVLGGILFFAQFWLDFEPHLASSFAPF